jgi:hypothetical protein
MLKTMPSLPHQIFFQGMALYLIQAQDKMGDPNGAIAQFQMKLSCLQFQAGTK